MTDLGATMNAALGLLAGPDPGLAGIVGLSLQTSLLAVLLAAMPCLPLGALLAVSRFPGRGAVVALATALTGLPPVVAGLAVYLVLSCCGLVGLMFTPGALVLAQAVLVAPVLLALSCQALEPLWRDYEEQLRSFGAGRCQVVRTLLWEGRFQLLGVLLAGFGRAAAELGAVLVVGGDIAGLTRTMSTAIMQETSQGDLAPALALGSVLLAVVVLANVLALALRGAAQR